MSCDVLSIAFEIFEFSEACSELVLDCSLFICLVVLPDAEACPTKQVI